MRIETHRKAATPQDTPAAVALGYFDGVHIGHQRVIAAARAYAQAHGLRLAVFTFTAGSKTAMHLLSDAQKHEQLAALGVDTCYEPPFSSFQSLSPETFFSEMLLSEYGAKALFCGDNFNFGAQRAGNVQLLRQLCDASGVALQVVEMAQYEGGPVSSSRIRQALAEGDIEDASAMLGRPYEIDLPVGHGKKLGSKLGFPTINQMYPPGIQPPAHGIYITQTFLEGSWWPSATGYGTRPTVDNSLTPSCETFIPGFAGNLYEQDIRVRFFKKIDDTQKFSSYDQLAAAVQDWAAQARAYFAV